MTGLRRPKTNFYTIPHDMCEILAPLTKAQNLVFHYILRHTWGFPDDDEREPKRLSFDDFINGREVRDRENGGRRRMDTGCGAKAKSTVGDALRGLALKHHLILIIEDHRDLARAKKWYRVRTPEDEGYPDIIDLDEYTVLRANERKLVASSRQLSTDKPGSGGSDPGAEGSGIEAEGSDPIIKKETKEKNWRKRGRTPPIIPFDPEELEGRRKASDDLLSPEELEAIRKASVSPLSVEVDLGVSEEELEARSKAWGDIYSVEVDLGVSEEELEARSKAWGNIYSVEVDLGELEKVRKAQELKL